MGQWMRKILFVICILFFADQKTFAENNWEQKADFPGDGRSAVSSFGFSDYGFVGLGYDGEDFRRSFYAYDPLTDSWFQTESLGGAIGEGLERNVAAAFTIGNKGYIGTGQGGDPFLNDFWEYNYLTNIWTPKTSVGGIDRRSGIGFSVEGKGYIGLGQDGSGLKKDLWQFDTISNTWTQKADFGGTARRLAVAFVIESRVFVGTGDDGAFKNDIYEYNAGANAWFLRNDFGGSARYGSAAFSLNGKGYLVCGYDTTLTNRNDFWEYDPITDSWLQLPDFPGGARTNLTAFVIDTMAFVGMGYDTGFHYDIWLWGDTTNIIHQDTTDTTVAVLNLFSPLENFELFPNPVNNYATVNINSTVDFTNALIRIYDMQGNDVSSRCNWNRISFLNNTTSFTFQNKDLPKGVYQMVVSFADDMGVKKFIVI